TLYHGRKEYPAAREAYEQAIQYLEELSGANPKLASYRARLATAYTNLAQLQDNTREFHASVASYRRGMALQEQLVKEHPEVPHYRHELATDYNNFAYLLPTGGGSATRGCASTGRPAIRTGSC